MTLSMEERELQRIREIQQHIVALLNAEVVVDGEEQDIYLSERLNSIIQNPSFWPWRLMLEPMNCDFLNLAYRVVLNRSPDQQGWNHFYARLSAGTASRADVMMEMVNSTEFRQTRPGSVWDGRRSLLVLHSINRVLRKVELLGRMCHLLWRFATGFRRKMRNELLIRKIQHDLNEVKEREAYLAEYLHNLERRRSTTS